MVTRTIQPFDLSMRHQGPSNNAKIIALASLGAHIGLLIYLATQQFAVPLVPAEVETKSRVVEIVNLRKKLAPPAPTPTQAKLTPSRPPIIRNAPPEVTVPIDPVRPTESQTTDKPPTGFEAPTVPQATAAEPPVIRQPAWIDRPSSEEMARHYPESAIRRGIQGEATIACTVTARGALTACRVVSETPAEERFGAAALKLARYFRLSPQTVNGRPVESAPVTIPIRFRLS